MRQESSKNNETSIDDNKSVIITKKDMFKIMITTDNHIGYMEHDQIRGNDSFNAFEEVLIKAKQQNVDFILHGGDLFHHHNPSKKTIIRVSHILRKHIFGQKEHEFQTYCYSPNYKNDNLSIELPIFIIHGNHDDPSGLENFSSIDIFSCKEVNYFGKINNYDEFELYPILFVKGQTKIAVYGIGNIKDERLYIALQNKKVKFNRPNQKSETDDDNWFNILVVHQNRFKGHYVGKSRKNFLPENLIPNFIDLVIWGHEHECFTKAIDSGLGFYNYQPGSSVATSMIAAEAKTKHVGILTVYKTDFKITPLKLYTARPFIYDTFELGGKNIKSSDDIEKIIVDKIESALLQAKVLVDQINLEAESEIKSLIYEKNLEIKNSDEIYSCLSILPLVRIKIETSGLVFSRTNVIVSKFQGLIANPNDVLQFYKKPSTFNKLNHSNEDISGKSTTINLDDEGQIDWDDELKRFMNNGINQEITSIKDLKLFPDIFNSYLEKQINGLDKKALDNLFKSFHESLCFKKNSNYENLDWNYIKNYQIEDTIVSRKDNFKVVNEVLKNIEFTFSGLNSKNEDSLFLKEPVQNDYKKEEKDSVGSLNKKRKKASDNFNEDEKYFNASCDTLTSNFDKNNKNKEKKDKSLNQLKNNKITSMFSKDEGKIKGKSENQKIKTTIDCLMDDEVKLKNHTIEGSNDNSLFISNRKNNIVNNSTISYNASNLNISNLDINNLDSKNYDNSFDNDFELKETHLKKSIINNKNINSNDSEIFSNEFYKPNKNKLSFFQESEEDNIVKIGNQMGLFDNSISNQGIPKRKQNNKPTRTSYSRYNKS